MKFNNFLVLFVSMSVFFTSSLAFAGHDHGGGQGSGSQPSTPKPADQQATKKAEQLLKNCSQHIDSIQRNVDRLHSKLSEKSATSSTNAELEKLDQKLQEAKELVRSLQIY